MIAEKMQSTSNGMLRTFSLAYDVDLLWLWHLGHESELPVFFLRNPDALSSNFSKVERLWLIPICAGKPCGKKKKTTDCFHLHEQRNLCFAESDHGSF